ncbi:sugar 3,4-ketoisomerase [Allobaculum mucilyticum]|uniref:sugar 3,4-ketoisomerase n=1 Tax=Allobaculum mucilyticum TaxID=2834459 RepID=UPI001E344DB1|nr:FdtA/QdtA family cupin domain-containing protein [Allobaculum mucilyticum]UNT95032.1 FdtA/QdtA family cupin domain-containing protein [Allobaculum mucilyticum]
MKYELLTFQQHGDDRGQLIAIEEGINVPFSVKRVYYMYDTKPGVRRGFHAHRELKQVLICVSGSCSVHLDDGTETEEILLDKPYIGLQIEGLIWREMYNFSEDAVLLVLASELYDESDYIRDYHEFKKEVLRHGEDPKNHSEEISVC